MAAHAEAFLISGDMNSALYTSSRAMHSSVLGLLQVGLILVTFPSLFRNAGMDCLLTEGMELYDAWRSLTLQNVGLVLSQGMAVRLVVSHRFVCRCRNAVVHAKRFSTWCIRAQVKT